MSLSKLEDFMGLGTHTLTNFLTVWGLKTTSKKAELVARAFSAFELNISKSSQRSSNKCFVRRNQRDTISLTLVMSITPHAKKMRRNGRVFITGRFVASSVKRCHFKTATCPLFTIKSGQSFSLQHDPMQHLPCFPINNVKWQSPFNKRQLHTGPIRSYARYPNTTNNSTKHYRKQAYVPYVCS